MVEPTLRASAPTPSRDELLRAAKASPEIAGRHDKSRWLSLYSDDAVVEDPVGTPASHKGRRLGRFYEAFIAPSGIEMVTRKDIISGMYVFRAVDIHTTNLKTGLQMKVPANLLYELVPRDGGLAIRRMQAHWEANRMGRELMGKGLLGLRTIAVMNWSMLRAFGWKWLIKYFQATQRGVGRKGREQVERLASEVGSTASVTEFLEGCTALSVRELLASGSTVSGLATIEWGARQRESGFVAELDSEAARILRLRCFWED
jgi:hypothetical protein